MSRVHRVSPVRPPARTLPRVTSAFRILEIAVFTLSGTYRDSFAQTVRVGYRDPVPTGPNRTAAESRTW